MRRLIWLASLAVMVFSCAAEQTWNGRISDDLCGRGHDIDEHGPPVTDQECTLACIKAGAAYVFVSGKESYLIQNQDYPALAEHAGRLVRLSGWMQDDTITIARLELP